MTENNIKKLREKTYLSQNKFAKLLGIPVANIQKWEQNISAPPEYVEKFIEYRLRELSLIE